MRKNEHFNSDSFSIGATYRKVDVAELGELTPPINSREWTGIIECANAIILFVTLDKTDRDKDLQYTDYFDEEGRIFFWDSQNRQSQKSPVIHAICSESIPVYLFCRIHQKVKNSTQPFTYIGKLAYEDHDGNNPVNFLYSVVGFNPVADEPLRSIYTWQRKGKHQLVPVEKPDRRKNKASGQGYVSDAAKNKAIEIHAMSLAKDHYESAGWYVLDTSASKPYDYECTKDAEIVRVEVKGTSSELGTVILTIGEIVDARSDALRTDLFVVYCININKVGDGYETEGGEAFAIEDWKPADKHLTPTQFRYQIPVT